MATDPVIKDHQLWIGFAQPEGLVVSPAALTNAGAVLSRNVGPEQETLRRNTVPDFAGNLRLKSFPAFTQEFWGWRDTDLAAPPEDLFARLPEYGETLRPTWVVCGGKGQPENLILVEELPWGTDFDKAVPSPAESGDRRWQASPQARFERLLRETGVPIGLLTSSEKIRLVYAPKGESSGHVTFPVHQMTMASNWPLLAALHLLLHSDRLFIGPETQRLPAILEASRRYQNEVSIRLAGQVLRALNELVRGFQEADRAAERRILGEALRRDPSHIYGGMLTTLMRMVFVLYAEDRSLMGSDETWLQNYSLSGLYERLRADEGQYPDTMDSRYGAWAQIITLTRLLYDGGGHGTWRLPPRHGGLFDPDAYPFLEGRPWQSKRATGALIEPPLVSDGILFRILQDLLYLDGERISYRALDVEQIGSVYEAMMGFTVETAHGVSIGLGSDHLVIDLENLRSKKPADRAKWLKENADCDLADKASQLLKSAQSIDEILAALRPRISKLYLDANKNPVTVPADGIYLQPTEERRRSGSHYTPRALTEPIVKTTLDPVLAQLGPNPTPAQILGLKVCDPAMGSGAFLVEVCRYLGARLEKAWIAHNEMPGIPDDQDPLLHARRIVAQRCLYGVDKNPFAVNLAKLSLWLATFAKDHPFTFVDHALRCGDSLVGLTAQQVESFHWQPKEEGGLLRDLPSQLRHVLKRRGEILEAVAETPYDALAAKLQRTEEFLTDLRLAGDLIVSAFFAEVKPKLREALRKELSEKFRRFQERVGLLELEDEFRAAVAVLKNGPKGVQPFHWDLEFPEVFRLDSGGARVGGFDAIVGNPPFAGKNTIANGSPSGYLDWLKVLHAESHGNSDLVAHFFRRSFDSLRPGGCFGLIATNTISQGDTRASGLRWICNHGGIIYSARKRYRWPGAAAVVVSVVHVSNGPIPGPYQLDDREVDRITAYLFHAGGHDNPAVLASNAGKSFQGSIVLGMGFTFDDTDKNGVASPLSEMRRLIEKDPRNAERIFPYLGGEEVNNSPTHAHHRYVINFEDFPLRRKERGHSWWGLTADTRREQLREGIVAPDYPDPVAADWPDLLDILETRVRPERMRQNDAYGQRFWWRFLRTRPELRDATKQIRMLTACARIGNAFAFVRADKRLTLNEKTVLFASESYAVFGALQSRTHEVWVRFFSSTLKDDLQYTPSDCFETFPFPPDHETNLALEQSGHAYYDYRAALMVRNDEGLTKTYNRFHNKFEQSPEIGQLRTLHAAMDRLVLDAYGWHDLKPESDFYPEFADDAPENPDLRRPRQPKFRYRWPDDIHDEVLARLLDLNRTRAEEESALAVPPAGLRKPRARGVAMSGPLSLFE